ncbi:AI-2E family transporter [Tissierella creatinini]|nr:AI-2E family transporter [Tissierella creatinini]TJX64685.1 AI-2E family transporter [Soehngenia saccharolytica]
MNNLIELLNIIIKDTVGGLKGYLVSRLIIMGIVFGILSIGFVYIGAPVPYLLAFLIALLDIIPLLGAGIVMIPWGLISYFGGNKDMAGGVLILYVILTIAKQFIEPKVLGDQIGIRPLYTFIATVAGSLIFGPLGLMVGPILAVIINSIIKAKSAMDKRDRS